MVKSQAKSSVEKNIHDNKPAPADTNKVKVAKKKNNKKRAKGKKKIVKAVTVSQSGDREESVQQTAPTTNEDVIVLESDDESSSEAPLPEEAKKPVITQRDLESLNSGAWLNDTIIDSSLKMLKEKYDKSDAVHISSSFFYPRLIRAKNLNEGYYQKTKNWFNNIDLFKKKVWLIPVCERSHWFLLAVLQPGHKNARIVVLNSMKMDTYKVAAAVRNFLVKKQQIEKKCKTRLPKIIFPDVPLQTNTDDCGLYLLRFAEAILKKPKSFSKSRKPIRQCCEDVPLLKRGELKNLLSA